MAWWGDMNFKEQCIQLRKQNYTLSEIVQITGRPKTSVFFHIQHISLSEEKKQTIRTLRRERLLSYALSRKGKSVRSFLPFDYWDEELVCLVSHLIFDGEIRKGCIYNNRSYALILRVQQAMRKVYAFNPHHSQNPHTGVHRIGYYNVALAAYLSLKAAELLKDIRHLPKELRRAFLQSFFDDEGCIDFRPERNHRRVRGYQKNVQILELVSALLSDFGIPSRIQLPNEVVISGKENLIRFQQEINFSPGIYINGNRSNSIWKKSLEKREILKSAIHSYLQ